MVALDWWDYFDGFRELKDCRSEDFGKVCLVNSGSENRLVANMSVRSSVSVFVLICVCWNLGFVESYGKFSANLALHLRALYLFFLFHCLSSVSTGNFVIDCRNLNFKSNWIIKGTLLKQTPFKILKFPPINEAIVQW